MLVRVLALSVFALGCHASNDGEGKPPCAPTTAVLQVSADRDRLCVGEVTTLRAAASDGCLTHDVARDVEWTTSALKVATVREGKVVALAKGTANIVAVQGEQTAGVRIHVIDCP